MKDRVALQHHPTTPSGAACSSRAAPSSRPRAATPARRWRWSRRMRGYKCVFVMPDKMSQEKVAGAARVRRAGRHLPDRRRARGPAQLLLGPRSASPRRRRTRSTRTSTTTPPTRRRTTSRPAPEIWEQTRRRVRRVRAPAWAPAARSAACGTFFKEKKPGFQIVGVDPIGSLYYDYVKTGRMTKPFSYKVEGIGEDFLPDAR